MPLHKLRRAGSLGPAIAITLRDTYSSTANSTSYSSSMSLGSAASGRGIIVAVAIHGSSDRIDSCTLGGVSMTKLASADSTDYASALFYIDNASSTTATVVASITPSSAARCSMAAYSIVNHNSSAVDTDSNSNTTGTTITNTLQIPYGGAAIFAASVNATTALSWSSATELDEGTWGEGGSYGQASLDLLAGAAAHVQTMTVGTSTAKSMVSASFRRG